MTDKPSFKRTARGERPNFFPDEPAAERLLAMVTALVTEVGVLKERQDTLEKLLEENGVVTEADIEAYQPSAEVEEARRQERKVYLNRIFATLQADIDEATATSK